MNIINICGVPHEVIFCDDNFTLDLHIGQIDYGQARIRINQNLAEPIMKVGLIHEWLHGALVALGYNEQSQDEQFVQAMATAINGSFEMRMEARDG